MSSGCGNLTLSNWLAREGNANINKPLVVIAKGGFIKPNHQYLTAYKGLIFYTKSSTELILPGDIEIIAAREI